uniref:Small RNA binding exonuclease protection factor La n=1 Tax=Loxodonta africana TaxID=9785 RepID=G3TTL3_LOXAF
MAENGDCENMAALEAKICHEIEYYFGDFILPWDKFLKEQIKLDEGWIPLEIMIKFNRLNRFTTDFNVIVEAVSKSKVELMEISEDKTEIRSFPSKPLPEVTDEYKNELKNRSVYIKAFPTDATLDDIKEWSEDNDQVPNILMRRTWHKAFKGSIFVVFDSIESAKKVVETPGQKYKDTDLLILFREDYFAKKNEERKQNKLEAKLQAKQEQEGKQKLGEDAEMKSLEEKMGCLLKFSGDLDDQIRNKMDKLVRGAKEGVILFKEALDKAKDASNGNLLRNKEVTWEVLEGEVEKAVLKKILEDQQESLNKWKSKGNGNGNKVAQAGSAKGKQLQGKKTKFDSDDECDENGAAGSVKRAREKAGREEPASKQQKTGNGSGDQ